MFACLSYGVSLFIAMPLYSPCNISKSFRSVSELLLRRLNCLPSSSSPSASSSCVRSSMVFRSFSYAAFSSEWDVSSFVYFSVRTASCASRSRACFSLRSRKARWAARFWALLLCGPVSTELVEGGLRRDYLRRMWCACVLWAGELVASAYVGRRA